MAVPQPTFRDPAGYVEFTGEQVLRHVHVGCSAEALKFLQCNLAQNWQSSGKMVLSEIEQHGETLLVRHPRIFFPSYPWEWAATQWRAAAHLTLELGSQGIPEGFLLKDATPLNILFEGSRPIFVDVLSFEPRNPSNAIWLAQGQFVRTFLLPLLAYRHLGWPLAASQVFRDGYEPGQLAEYLGGVQRFNPRLLWPVTLPAWLDRRQKKTTEDSSASPSLQRSPELAAAVLQRIFRRLGQQIDRASGGTKHSRWSEYPATSVHYSAEDHAKKKNYVAEILQQVRPKAVLDIGANTGVYSMLAASAGARVVSLDTDVASIDQLAHRAAKESCDILALVGNIARPTPALGWENAESLSFLDRAEQRFDLVMMLAVLHHLLLMDQVPLEKIAALAARLTRRHLVLEWVPQADPMFQSLLRGRNALYAGLTAERMQNAFCSHFSVKTRCELSNGRVLFLLEKR